MADDTSHDHNFKNLIVDYPRQALEFFAPGQAPGAEDDVRVVPVRQEQLKDRLGDAFRALDVPLLVEWADERREAVAFALEEETDPRRFSPHRLVRYCADLSELLGTTRVVPVVVFLRPGAAPASLALGAKGETFLAFHYVACHLADLPAERWLDSRNLVARVNLPNMRCEPGRRVEVYAHAVRGLLELEPDPAKQGKYIDFIDIYADLTDNERRRYEQQYQEEARMVVGRIQRAREEGETRGHARGRIQGRAEGHAEGRAVGHAEGHAEGERAVLGRLLRRRFGPLPSEAAERVGGASTADLEAWAENVLDAKALDDVFKTAG